jgi:hypothetical protein
MTMKSTQLSFAFLLCAASVVQAQPIERVKLTDNDLNCQAMYDEIHQMEALVAKGHQPALPGSAAPDAATGAAVVGAVAQQAAAQGGFGGFGGFGGLLGGLAQAAAGQQASGQQASAAQAQQPQWWRNRPKRAKNTSPPCS